MAKYDALQAHLRRQKLPSFEMSFADIEQKIGAWLPKSAHRPEWWANDMGVGIQREAWLSAGYDASLIRGTERVRFQRRG